MHCFRLLALLLLLTSGIHSGHAAVRPDTTLPHMGVNLGHIIYWNELYHFVDLFNNAKWWQTGNNQWVAGGQNAYDTGVHASFTFDIDGYPMHCPVIVAGQEAPQVVHTSFGLNGKYPAGRYTLLYDGTGNIELTGDVTIASQTPGRWEVDVTPSDAGIRLKILESDTTDHVRNIRFIMPGHENTYATQPFYPPFLEKVRPFHVLRFMNWMWTNGSTIAEWSDQPPPGYYTQGEKYSGVAYEYITQLCNEVDADCWFTIPHLASDDYLRQAARFLRDSLETERRVYVEYSNEVWNSEFTATQWTRTQGLALGLSTNARIAGLRFQAQRSVDIFRIFDEEFAGTDRLVKVLAGQAAWSDPAEQVLSWFHNPSVNPDNVRADALAITMYFGGKVGKEIGDAGEIATISTDEILDRAEASIDAVTIPGAVTHKTLADQYGLRLLTYEAGSHLRARGYENNVAMTDKLITADRHARMESIIQKLLAGWYDAGGDLYMHFTLAQQPGQNGSFGALEWFDQPLVDAHKYRALVQYSESGGVVTGITEIGSVPNQFHLAQNFPNPFNPSTTIRWSLPRDADVRLTIYNLLGQPVRTLVNGRREAGRHQAAWDGLNDRFIPVASGVYLMQLITPDNTATRKMLLLR